MNVPTKSYNCNRMYELYVQIFFSSVWTFYQIMKLCYDDVCTKNEHSTNVTSIIINLFLTQSVHTIIV